MIKRDERNVFKGPTNRIFRHTFHVNSIKTIFTNTHTPAHKDTHPKCASHHISLRLTSHTTLFPLHVVIPRSPVMSRDIQCVPRRAGAPGRCQYGAGEFQGSHALVSVTRELSHLILVVTRARTHLGMCLRYFGICGKVFTRPHHPRASSQAAKGPVWSNQVCTVQRDL